MAVATIEQELRIDFDYMSEEQFDLEVSVKEAIEKFNQLKNEGRLVNSSFDDDIWISKRLDYQSLTNTFDFNRFNGAKFSNSIPNEFKDIVRCWVVELFITYKTIAVDNFPYLADAFGITKGFREDHIKVLLDEIEHRDIDNSTKHKMIAALCNFFDFSNLEIAELYVPKLIELRNKIPNKGNFRLLPPIKDVLSFSHFLDKKFEELINSYFKNEETKMMFLLIYPLVIWWRLTTIIPIRGSEFCLLDRNCVYPENGKFYIKLPRRKLKQNRKRVQILDNILIDESIYQLITEYQNLTKEFGATNTLVSYRSILKSDSKNRIQRKKDIDQFSIYILRNLISNFYNLMENEYECSIPKGNRLRPNDTRHLAFVSLMMQGYSPIEIARLGGHHTVEAQYHYSYHTEYWVDCETFKLMTKMKNFNTTKTGSTSIPNEIKMKVFDYSDEGYRKKLKIGYCKDKEQRCESKKCYFCSHWGITAEEFLEKQDKIKKEIQNRKNKINEIVAVINNIHQQFLKDELSRNSAGTLTTLKQKTNAVQNEIENMAKLYSNLGERLLFND